MGAQLIPLRRTPERPAAAGVVAPPPVSAASDAAWLSDLIGQVYEAPGARQSWKAVLESIKVRLGAKHAVFMLRAPTAGQCGLYINSVTENEEARISYEREYFAADPFVGLSDGDVVTADDVLGSRWRVSSIYQEYLRPLDVRHLLAADIRTPEGAHCSLRLTRSHDAPAFDAENKALIRLLVPHIRRSVGLWSRIDSLECDRQVFAGTVERLTVGVISVGANGEVVQVNEEARRILEQKDGIDLCRGGLSVDLPSERKELQRIVLDAIARAGQDPTSAEMAEAMAITRPSGHPSLAVMVKRAPSFPGVEQPRRAHAVIYLRDPRAEAMPPSEQLVRRVFGLTRVEARVAMLLTEGLSLDEAAAVLDIRRNTARTHLRAVFAKTGVSRQTLLVRLMMRSVMSLA